MAERTVLHRTQYVLASMSVAGQSQFSPVQVQKLFFLLDQNVSSNIGGPFFKFEAYDYGPFDKEVYHEIELLQCEGMIEIVGMSWNRGRAYKITDSGLRQGNDYLGVLPARVKSYIEDLVQWVLRQSFSQLVSFIYREYPDMKVNSVFRG